MNSSRIDLLVKKFNDSSNLCEAEHSYIREGYRFSYVYFNGRNFVDGFKGNECTFIVNHHQRKILVNLKDDWQLFGAEIGIDLFRSIQSKLYQKFKLFFEFKNDSLVKLSDGQILYSILEHFFRLQNDQIASEEEIMFELKKYTPFRNFKFKDLDRNIILPRLCAGLNESRKFNYFFNDGTINDISLIDRNMSMQNYFEYLERNLGFNFSLMSVVRIYYTMYSNFKVHTVIPNWHRYYGYNLNFEIKGVGANIIFEKFIYNCLDKILRFKVDSFELSGQIYELYKDNSTLWLIENIFNRIVDGGPSVRFKVRYDVSDKAIVIYGLSDLILLIPFVFKNLFHSFDIIICYGSSHSYTLTKYKKNFKIDSKKL